MSNYTSWNTTVLATHMAAGNNEKMLLLYRRYDGSLEYIVGSYFTTSLNPDSDGGEYAYSWYWGHYFDDVVSAVDYWKNDVLNG